MEPELSDKEIHKENYEDVLYELILFYKYKYTELVKHIRKQLNTQIHNISFYTFKNYNFNNKLKIFPRIYKYGCCSYDLVILTENNSMYSISNIFDEENDLNLISTFDEDELKIDGKNCIEKIKIIVDFIDNFSKDYEYSRYLDEFISKNEINRKIKIEEQIDQICKKSVEDCIICYHKVNDNLTTCCCNKHICRICINKIVPLKCPNCRNDNF